SHKHDDGGLSSAVAAGSSMYALFRCRKRRNRRADLALFLEAFVAVLSELAVFPQRSARTGRDETADDDVLLEPFKRIDLALDCRLGEDAGGLLERCRGEEGSRLQGGLGDAQQNARALGGIAPGFHRSLVGLLE